MSKILPPTPESYKFATYGNLPVGLFTGATNFNIPLTTFNSKNISIPIGLNYSSNGIKLDDMNGSAGLGWTFMNAGVITRVIRDEPDELNGFANGDVPDINALGLYHPTVTSYLSNIDTDGIDSEPDLYMANFAGRSLKFVVDRNGNSIQLDKTSCKITGNGGVITTEDGTKYIFAAQEQVRNSMTNTAMHGPVQINTTSWYLTKIVNTNGEEINIEYYDKTYTATIAQSQSLSYTLPGPQQFKYGPLTQDPSSNGTCSWNCDINSFTMSPNIGLVSKSDQTVIAGKQIKKIYDQSGNSMRFIYADQANDFNRLIGVQKYNISGLTEDLELKYFVSLNNRVFLTEVLNKKSQSKYGFEYYNPEDLPERLSFKRDMWGYYNAKNNINLIPQIFDSNSLNAVQYNGADQTVNSNVGYYGLLKKIIYPTGGNSEMVYENHKVKENTLIAGQTALVNIQTTNDNFTNLSTAEQVIIPKKTGYISIRIGANTNGSCTGSSFPTNKMKANLSVYNNLTQQKQDILKQSTIGYNSQGMTYSASHGSYDEVFVNVQKDVPYKISVSARWFCADAYANVKYQSTEDTYVLQDKLLGGYRVKSVTDNSLSGIPVIRNYQYLNSNGNYSLIQIVEPYFQEVRHIKSICQNLCQPPLDNVYYNITSSNLSQYNGGQPNICYTTVSEETSGGRGSITHHFTVSSDGQGSVFGDYISGTAWSNEGWDNGKEFLTEYKNDQGILLKTIEYEYKRSNESKLFGLSVRKKFDPQYTSFGQVNYDHLDMVLYNNSSRFAYLASQKTTDYYAGNSLVTLQENFYNNQLHYQPTSEKKTFPDLSSSETTYSYAHEKGNQLMIGKNMIGIPLETTTTQTIGGVTKTLGKTETVYPTSLPTAQAGNLVLPLSSVSYDVLNNASSTEVTYDKYDDKGNLLQYTGKDGIPVSIIWGYNKTQPIAKVEGMSYNQLTSSVSIAGIVTASDNDAADPTQENALLSALNTFRKEQALSGKPVSTYTYDPLIGVTSITPPSGVRQSYSYDAAGRLKEGNVRGKNSSGSYINKKVSENNYNYKP
ncbi:hypothetical protein [uncultured Chryseobacterium sp.]|uniref:hypothetical protein n=1 Tax=uncultured Chryseobacterium sp. TaxID=259322 RepID=UPI0025DDB670|nr:hypothetical protein [uncultured Chryseobacterium sp.]